MVDAATQTQTASSKESVWGKVFVGVVTALVVAWPAYHFNEYLSRDRLTIESAEIVPDRTAFPMPRQTLRELRRSQQNGRPSEFGLWLGEQSNATQDLFDDRTGSTLTASGAAQLAEALEALQIRIDGRIVELEEFAKRWNARSALLARAAEELSRHVTDGSLVPSADLVQALAEAEMLLREAWDLGVITEKFELPADIAVVSRSIPSIIGRCKNDSKTCARFLADAKQFHDKRTGEANIVVTFLNKGGTDGLISTSGTLAIDNGAIRVPIQLARGNNRKIERHSVSELTYTIATSRITPEDDRKLRPLIINGERHTATVELYGTRGDSLQFRAEIPGEVNN